MTPGVSPHDFVLHCNRTNGSLDLGLFVYSQREMVRDIDMDKHSHCECIWVTTHGMPLGNRYTLYGLFGISISNTASQN